MHKETKAYYTHCDAGRIVAIGAQDTAIIMRHKEEPPESGEMARKMGSVIEEYHIPEGLVKDSTPKLTTMPVVVLAFYKWCSLNPKLREEFLKGFSTKQERIDMTIKKQEEKANPADDDYSSPSAKELLDHCHDELIPMALACLTHNETKPIARILSIVGMSITKGPQEVAKLDKLVTEGSQHIITEAFATTEKLKSAFGSGGRAERN